MGDDAELKSRARTRPSQEIYKPPLLRGEAHRNSRTSKNESSASASSSLRAPAVEISFYGRKDRSITSCDCPASEPLLLEKEPVDEFNFEHLIRDLKKELNIDDSLCAGLLKRSKMSPNQAASQIGHFLVKNVIENCGHKRANRGILSRAFVTLASTPIAASFCDGVTKSLLQYFECRDQLRGQEEFIAIWLNFVALAYEFVQISQEDNIVQLLFDVLGYLFSESVVDSLKIGELESTLSALMIIAPRIEAEYPAQLDHLKESVRSAFVSTSESWVRKMLMLIVELGAAEWRLSPEVEEFYFN